MSNYYAIKMMLGGVGALVAFAVDGRLSPGLVDDQKVKESAEERACLPYASEFSSKLGVNGVRSRWYIRKATIEGTEAFVIHQLPNDSERADQNEPHVFEESEMRQ